MSCNSRIKSNQRNCFHIFFIINFNLFRFNWGISNTRNCDSLTKIGTFLLPTIIIILSVLVITISNPVYALVCLILVFFSTALFLLSINVNFLALIYLIIYIGAIAILFLFVIMMFNLRELEKQSTQLNDYSFISISFLILFINRFEILFFIFRLCLNLHWIWYLF